MAKPLRGYARQVWLYTNLVNNGKLQCHISGKCKWFGYYISISAYQHATRLGDGTEAATYVGSR